MAKNILVIGGNRFFGRHLVTSLLEKGHKPVLFNRQNIDDGFGDKVERIKGDRDNYDKLREAAHSRQWDFVFDQVCFTASQSKMAAMHFEKNVGRYIVTSSESVYDYGVNLSESAYDPFHYRFTKEADRMIDYAEAKRQMEATLYQKAAFPVLAVRIPIVLGTDDYTKRLNWHFSRLKSGQGVFFPNLQARMQFINSKEVGHIIGQLMDVDWARPLNVASSQEIAMQSLLQLIENAVGKSFKLDREIGSDNQSPFGIKKDWFLNLDQLNQLGIKSSKLMDWLPELIAYEAKLLT